MKAGTKKSGRTAFYGFTSYTMVRPPLTLSAWPVM